MKLGKKCEFYINDMSKITLFNNIKCDIKIFEGLNYKLLGTFIGDNDFIRQCLNNKLDQLQNDIDRIVELPDYQMYFLLMYYTSSFCKSVHFIRAIPPPIIEPFCERYDEMIRMAFEKIIGAKLSNLQWNLASV